MIQIYYTSHARKRLRQRKINRSVVDSAILKTGRVLRGWLLYLVKDQVVIARSNGKNSIRVITAWKEK
jgi:hypothetical protein